MLVFSVATAFQAMLAYNITAIAQAISLEKTVDTSKDFIKNFVSKHVSDMSDWGYIVTALPIVFLLIAVFGYLHRYLIEWIGKRVVMDIRNQLYRHLHKLSLDFFDRSRTGELISRITNDVSIIEASISRVSINVLVQPVKTIILLCFLFTFSTELALIVIIGFPLIVVPVQYCGRRIKKNARRIQGKMADLTSILQETLSGIRVVKAFSMQDHEIEKFETENSSLFRFARRIIRLLHAVRPFIELIGGISISFVIIYGIKGLELTLPEIFAFAATFFMMYEPIKKISQVNANIQRGIGASERIFEILDTEPTITNAPNAKKAGELEATVSFQNVCFSYDSDQVLNNINLDINKGEIVALVGPSGAGKTSIANLLLRFYDPDSGGILIDGSDLRDVTIESLRAQIGIVTQETILFNDSVMANIAYGTPDMPLEEIQRAAKAANAHDFIMKMPEQYETVIGERGMTLSGGQRQRIAIARAILKNPPLLILDEATSSLDTESERLVQTAIDNLMRERTVMVIAHRLSTIKHATKIVVLESGKIVQQGNHDNLLAQGGLYKKLYDMQFNL
jgi:ATP-binding cassette, subfamily B, bacterial MsbA